MSIINRPTPTNQKSQGLQCRQLLATAATLGIAPWLLSAGASPTASTANVAEGAAARQLAAGQRRKLGTLDVVPVGLGCQWRPGAKPGVVVDSYSSQWGLGHLEQRCQRHRARRMRYFAGKP